MGPGPAQGQGRRVGRRVRVGVQEGPTCPQGPGEEGAGGSTVPLGRPLLWLQGPGKTWAGPGARGRGLGARAGPGKHVDGAWEHGKLLTGGDRSKGQC